MKKFLLLFSEIFILMLVWILCVFVLLFIGVFDMYFLESRVPAAIASISTLLLVIAYTIFWVKRFKKSSVNN